MSQNNSNNKGIGKNILFAGVGGQGILLMSEFTARAAIHAGFDAKKTEIHGASQRGGSVISHVRYSPKVYSPLVPAGEVDILLGLEKMEGLRWAHYLRPGGLIVLNNEERAPVKLTDDPVVYPKDIEGFLAKKGYAVRVIDALPIANSAGDYRAINTVLLGAISNASDISEESWHAAMKESMKPKILDLNMRAFEKGKALK